MTTPQNQTPVCCQDLLHILFNLNTLDITVFKQLHIHNNSRADELAKYMNKERSTIYRSLQKLTDCGFCTKKTHTLEGGGYYHTYACSDTKQVQQDLQHCLDHWYQQMKQVLQQFNTELA